MPELHDIHAFSFEPSNKIYVRSEEVQEIISRKSSVIEILAIPLFVIILLCIFTCTYIIKYPDIITVKAKLISINAPKEIKSKIDGRLIKLTVKESMLSKIENSLVTSLNILG